MKNILKTIYNSIKNKKKWEFYRLYLKGGWGKRYIMKQDFKFLNYIFDVPDMPSFIWQFKDIYVNEMYRFKPIAKIPIIIDCGANIGTSLLYFSENYPNAKIIGFEADEVISKICESNIARNGCFNAKVISKAVWIDEQGIEFSIEGADGGSIMGQKENARKVESIRLKDILDTYESIDLLKMDIEGAEHEVLLDCENSLTHVQNLFIEYHSWNNSVQKLSEIIRVLEKNGFRYYIEGASNRKHPFINHGREFNMDLQLNIFGVKHA